MDAENGRKLTPGEIDRLKITHNMTQVEIARLHGVTKSAVTHAKQRGAGDHYRTPREIVRDNYPWVAGDRFNRSTFERNMRNLGEYVATGGKDMKRNELKRVHTFLTHVIENNVVVEFDPEIPPMKGNKYGGFAYRERLDSDGDLVFRQNHHTRLTEYGKRLWRVPKILPRV
jgi:hypothetical protein